MHILQANFLILARASFIEGTAILSSREAGAGRRLCPFWGITRSLLPNGSLSGLPSQSKRHGKGRRMEKSGLFCVLRKGILSSTCIGCRWATRRLVYGLEIVDRHK